MTLPSPSPTQLLSAVRHTIPPLTVQSLRKGQSGRIAIVGGSEEYTGAPYFAGMTALRMGADLCHIFCEHSAAAPIKSYSPDLIVHPSLRSSSSISLLPPHVPAPTPATLAEPIVATLPRLHVLLLGPGLSRDKAMLDAARIVLREARRRDLPVVVDADGLFLVQNDPDLVKGYTRAVVTPNGNEFERLCEKMNIPTSTPADSACLLLAQALGGVTVVQKGARDVISDGSVVVHCSTPGSPRRCGGQGDLLSGATATFLAWADLARGGGFGPAPPASPVPSPVLAAWSACHLTRLASRVAFGTRGRSVIAQDLVEVVGRSFAAGFEGAEGDVQVESEGDVRL
ncbi:Ribokinase-like protein [Gonapodya prolifera JEL478]|uniref:ATP-dependent (S)-NAD(P)H-hydrate dehydratase n=1 Tax=Gonapodya prolifera (strain JEL478) TaxID=1344416 RepID=A0A139B0K9_GONPJ|nr:Ribokinase-like protein [Gonapodya prolifera JEL478]|eukprot:KXS22509.1 Ribokinase-like protein [Gonapodya prolifera JEL478]